MSKTGTAILCGAASLLACAAGSGWGQVSQIPTTVEQQDESPQTRTTMHSKLLQSQRVMEGLVRRDFEAIEEAASILKRISLSPPPKLSSAGDKSDEQVYEHFRLEFARLAGQLERQARRREPEATAWVQQNLTATCIACHDYIRDFPQ
ncbi:MAG: hypothetical protein NXI04_21515 [Planctomycetaceae bacterium]|nr:hypothetical protein [Planctomycetaceae bacterium]